MLRRSFVACGSVMGFLQGTANLGNANELRSDDDIVHDNGAKLAFGHFRRTWADRIHDAPPGKMIDYAIMSHSLPVAYRASVIRNRHEMNAKPRSGSKLEMIVYCGVVRGIFKLVDVVLMRLCHGETTETRVVEDFNCHYETDLGSLRRQFGAGQRNHTIANILFNEKCRQLPPEEKSRRIEDLRHYYTVMTWLSDDGCDFSDGRGSGDKIPSLISDFPGMDEYLCEKMK